MTHQELRREAEFFHQKIFGRPIPEELREAFVAANVILLSNAALNPVRTELILRRSLDVEAIEFALRRMEPANVLSKKLFILSYLTESRSDYFETFVNEEAQAVSAVIKLLLFTCRSVYKLLKGRFLIWMYDVV